MTWTLSVGGKKDRLETGAVGDLPGPRRQAVVLGISQLALRDRRPHVVDVPCVDAQLTPGHPITDAAGHRRVRLGKRGIPLVEKTLAYVVHHDVRIHSALRREDDAGAEQIERRHLQPLAAELYDLADDVLREVARTRVVVAVA